MLTRIEDELQALRNIFINYPKHYNTVKEQQSPLDREVQDLLHALELGNLNAVEQSRVARDLKEVSVKRRKVKDDLAVLREIDR